MLKWLKLIAVGLVSLAALIVLAGAGFEAFSRSVAAQSFRVQGRLVDVGNGRRVQLDCRGSGAPTVVFESGLDTLGSLSWAAVQDGVAKTTRACAYSRAGIMWSDPARGPFRATSEADELHELLLAAGERPPFVMVGHSLGGPYVMTFTGRFPHDVAGVVLVDASHPDQVSRIHDLIGRDLDDGDGMIKAADALAWSGAVRLFAPKETIAPPSAPRAAVRAAAAWQPQSIHGAVRESKALNDTLAAAGRYRDLGDRPLVVLTRTATAPPEALKAIGLTVDQGRQLDAEWRAMQNDEATWSKRSRHEIVPDASHFIQFDQPRVVIAAVLSVVAQTRGLARIPPPTPRLTDVR